MLVIRGFLEARKHSHLLLPLVDVMYTCGCQLPCFKGGATALADLRARFLPQANEQQVRPPSWLDGLVVDGTRRAGCRACGGADRREHR
jgi:hypothetical protein